MYYSNIVCGIGSGTWKTTKGKRRCTLLFLCSTTIVCGLLIMSFIVVINFVAFLKKGKWKNDDGAKGVCYLSREAEGTPTWTWLLKLR